MGTTAGTGADLREKLRGEIQVVDASSLLPHQRRGALLIAQRSVDILDVAVAIASDDASRVAALVEEGSVYKPSLGQLADWCVDTELRMQFVILQPYVLAQPIEAPGKNYS